MLQKYKTMVGLSKLNKYEAILNTFISFQIDQSNSFAHNFLNNEFV